MQCVMEVLLEIQKEKSLTFRLKTAGFPGSSLAAFSTQNSALLSHSSLLTSNSATFSTRSLWAGFKSTDRYIHTKKGILVLVFTKACRHVIDPKGQNYSKNNIYFIMFCQFFVSLLCDNRDKKLDTSFSQYDVNVFFV